MIVKKLRLLTLNENIVTLLCGAGCTWLGIHAPVRAEHAPASESTHLPVTARTCTLRELMHLLLVLDVSEGATVRVT